jgi:hypothetical protein
MRLSNVARAEATGWLVMADGLLMVDGTGLPAMMDRT